VRLRRPTGTEALAGLAGGLTLTAVVLEYLHVWRKGHAPLPADRHEVLEAGAEAARETAALAVAGYRKGSSRENALLNLLLSFAVTGAIARASTHIIRSHGKLGPFRNARMGDRHIHHFIPGIVMAFAAGGVSITSRNEDLDKWLAVPFGAGMALTLDEAALLIELEDVYWSKEGVLSVQVLLGTMAALGAVGIGLRVMRRGELELLADPVAGVLDGGDGDDDGDDDDAAA